MTLRVQMLLEGNADGAKRAVNDTAAAMDKLNVRSRGAATAGDLVTASAARQQAAMVVAAAAAQRHAAMANLVANSQKQMAFQLNDVFVSLASGMNPMMVLIQQGSQITQIYGGAGGVAAAFRDTASMATGLIGKVWPLAAAGAALWGAYELVSFHVNTAKDAISSATAKLAEQAAPVDSLRSKVADLREITRTYAEVISDTATASTAATREIVANSEKEFNAKKSLLELELKRQQAALEVQRAEIANNSQQLKREIAQKTPSAGSDLYGLTNSFSDPKVGQFVRAPYQDPLLERTQQIIDSTALGDKIKELRANLALTEIGASGLESVLKTTFSGGVAESVSAIAAETAKANGAAKQLADDGLKAVRTEIITTAMVIKEQYKDVFTGLFMDLKAGLKDGEDGFGALARAASNALDEIANKALQQTASGLWDMIFGAIGGGGGGWKIPNVFQPGGFFPGLATGGTVTQGGWTMVGERGPELLNLPSGSKVMNNQVSAQALAGAGGGTIVQIIDQRKGGKAVRQEEGRGLNGEKIIRAIIEDEIREGVRRGKYEF